MKLNPYTYGERGTVMYTGEGVVLPIQGRGSVIYTGEDNK